MTESEIIWEYLMDSYPNDHQAISVYAKDKTYNLKAHSSIDSIYKIIYEVFSCKNEINTKTIIKAFLDMKRHQYEKGEIKIFSRY